MSAWLDRWSKIDFGEKIIIVVIAVEIVLSIGAIWLTIHEAGLQEEAQQKVVADLATMNLQLGVLNGGITQTVSKLGELNAGINHTVQALAESSSTSKKINQALGSQLGILTEQQGALSQQAGVLNQQLIVQKQQWNKENQRPGYSCDYWH
jgi:hypothetical protein